MIKAHPRWVLIGGCGLAFLSAAINAVFLIRLGASVAHLTGDVSNVAVNYVHNHSYLPTTAYNLIAALLGFVTGAAAAGYFIHHPTLEFSRPYGRSISTIGACLVGAHYSFVDYPLLAVILASFACGLQNALATHYRGIVLRTTHVTGLLTDLGSNIGMKLKGHILPYWKITVPMMLTISFLSGACFGSLLVIYTRTPVLLILAGMYMVGGISWTTYKHLWLRRKPPSSSSES